MNFWIVAGLMTAAALAVALLPLLRVRRSARGRRPQNLEIYRRRLRQLEAEVEEGLLEPEEVEATRAELEKRLLEDLGDEAGEKETEETSVDTSGAGKLAHRTVFFLILLALPLGAVGLYTVVGLDREARERLHAAETGRTDAEMTELVSALSQRLERNPGNGEGWALLGRSYLFLERPGKAAEAFARARELLGDEPRLLIDYANALAMRSGGDFRGPAGELVQEALAKAPDDPRALWFAGLAAAQRGDTERAESHWRKLLGQFAPGSEDATIVRRQLARLGADTAASPGETKAAGEGAAPAPGITVEVTLADDIASRAAPTDPVFVFARAADGSPMPLAAVRRQVADLPLTVRLDDEDAMIPGRSLSDADRVVVGARISHSGGPIPQSGDLQGTSEALRPADAGEIRIVIDSVVP